MLSAFAFPFWKSGGSFAAFAEEGRSYGLYSVAAILGGLRPVMSSLHNSLPPLGHWPDDDILTLVISSYAIDRSGRPARTA
jgi:hypothetical protein